MISGNEALSRVALSKDEEMTLAKLEAAVDSYIYSHFDGAPCGMEFQQAVPPKVIYALQRKYEAAGWRIFNVKIEKDKCSFAMSLASGMVPAADVATPKALPPVIRAEVGAPTGKRLLVRMPTRGRPLQALEVLERYRSMAGTPITIEVVLDEDDESMMAAEVLQRLNALGCIITVGQHKSKVEAVNGGKVSDWDVLLLASDDMWPLIDGYAVRVLQAMEEKWPHLDGAIYFDDGHQGSACCTLPIMGKRWYNQQRVVYSPEYTSLFCDQEQTELWLAMDRLSFVDEKIIEHRHPAWGRASNDSLYTINNSFWAADEAVYKARKMSKFDNAQFAFRTDPIWLSICICTLPARRAQLDLLVDNLYRQIADYAVFPEIEVLVDNREGITIGEKRQALLEKAKGHFVAYIDDDDGISHSYVKRILDAILANPEVDCISLRGVMTSSGAAPEIFENSLKHTEWSTKDGVHRRMPNHLNPVRRELALKAGFPAQSHAEDYAYSTSLLSLLKTEASAGETPLYMYWYQPTKLGAKTPVQNSSPLLDYTI